MANAKAGSGIPLMSLAHLLLLETKEVLKKWWDVKEI
jgi:hypothetical protein